jgi:hypothetical protein
MENNFDSEALDRLVPIGFQQQREHFFLVREPNILVLYKSYFRGVFQGYYLAFTHTFFSNVVAKKHTYKIPPFLESYPVSISTSQLQIQFQRHALIEAFDCSMNFMTREVFPTRHTTPPSPASSRDSGWSLLGLTKLLAGKKRDHSYSNNPVDVVLDEGLRFFEQFSPMFSYQVLTKYGISGSSITDSQLGECRIYLDSVHSNHQER